MPGSKRRALKKAVQAITSPSPPIDGFQSPSPPVQVSSPIEMPSTSAAHPPPPPPSVNGHGQLRSTSGSEHHLHIPFMHRLSSEHHHHLSPNADGSHTNAKSPAPSGNSIASDPGNYLSDEEVQEDLAIEGMMLRGMSIGSGDHRTHDGVPDLKNKGGTPMPPGAHEKTAAERDEEFRERQSMVTADEMIFGQRANGVAEGSTGEKKKGSKQRHAERQARKKEALLNSLPPEDPSWTAQLLKERDEEIEVIMGACSVLGRYIHEIAPDGHCMFNAIADQLCILGKVQEAHVSDPKWMRRQAADYMLAHPDDFMPFLPSITGEDSAGATSHDGMMTKAEFQKYCSLLCETGEWGGEPEIQALSRRFQIPIHVVQRGPPTVVSHGGSGDDIGGALTPEQSAKQGNQVVRISYHKRMYGLGEHYNSLRKAQ